MVINLIYLTLEQGILYYTQYYTQDYFIL